MCEKLLAPILLTGIPLVALASWALAYKIAGKNGPSLTGDLKSLFVESIPFLRTQWLFLTICASGGALSSLQYSHIEGFAPTVGFGAMVCAGIMPILKLFYVSYLASPKNHALVSTIGVWTMILYLVGEYIQNMFITMGFCFLVIPGLYIMARTSLFLPIYAVEGHRPFKALDRSWAITRGKFWQTCLYLGPLVCIVLLSHWLPLLATTLDPTSQRSPVVSVMQAFFGMTGTLLDILLAGLMYKLYQRFNAPISVDK